MKYLVFGLGNPGEKYKNTRHNIGFRILNQFAFNHESEFSTERHADVAKLRLKGKQILLVKPNTFMNLSGKAVNYWMQKEKVGMDNILIVVDDIALPFNSIRMKPKGSDGGHNGLKDIIETLSSSKFPRLRFGVGSDFYKGSQSNYVLDCFTDEEEEMIDENISISVKMIYSFIVSGINQTMNDFNR